MDAAEATLLASEETELPSDRVADLVEYIVCGLVDDEDAVSLDVTDSELSKISFLQQRIIAIGQGAAHHCDQCHYRPLSLNP